MATSIMSQSDQYQESLKQTIDIPWWISQLKKVSIELRQMTNGTEQKEHAYAGGEFQNKCPATEKDRSPVNSSKIWHNQKKTVS